MTDNVKSQEDFLTLVDSADNHIMDDFWRIYGVNEFKFAYKKNNLSNNIDDKVRHSVEKLIKTKYKV